MKKMPAPPAQPSRKNAYGLPKSCDAPQTPPSSLLQTQLRALAEPTYQAFSSKLLPGVPNILGVRLPMLRKIAKKISQDNGQAFLSDATDNTFEEIMVQGMVIGHLSLAPLEKLALIRQFLPKIDNWSICDSFCCGLKGIQNSPEIFWPFLTECSASSQEFIVRFAHVAFLQHFLNEAFVDPGLAILVNGRHPGYYAKMSAAWALSLCFLRFPQKTISALESPQLDRWILQKTIQKIKESRQLSPAQKETLAAHFSKKR